MSLQTGIHQDTIRDEYMGLREKILIQLDGMKDTDKAKFLRSELNLINQKIESLEGFSSSYIERLKALQALQQSLLQAEDIVKVHEARLTEKETSSLEDSRAALKEYQMCYKELLQEKESLRMVEQVQGRVQKNEDELKQLWKLYELKYDTEKGKVQELESFRSEIEKLTALEDRYKGQLQSSVLVVSQLAWIRDELEKGRAQKKEDELEKLWKDWKSQYERKSDTDKGKLQQELVPLTSEIKTLTAKLSALEVGDKKCSHTSTYISSLKEQLQTNITKVEQELTQNNHEIGMLTTKLQSFENVVSELAWIRDELEKGRVPKNEDELKQLLKVFEDWKSQYERKSDTDKGKLQQEHESLWCEIETLTTKLRVLEDRYKGQLQISELQQRELKLFQKRLEHLEERIKVHHRVITIKEMTVSGIRGSVSITDLVESKLLNSSDVQKIAQGQLTIEDIESKLRPYLQGSGCIAGIFLEKENRTLPIYQAKKEGLLRQGTSLVLLEAQAASGFMIDPLNNLFLPVEEACERNLIGQEFKSKLLSAENAVTGYKDPHTGDIISLFQAIEKGIIEKGHGIRLLEAQIASGGIIDPKKNHRIDVDEAFRRGYFNKEMNDILADEGDDTKGFFDPNTEENLTYLQLMKRCITDEKTGLVLLPLWDKKESRILRMREQECEWEGIIILAADSSIRLVVVDQKTEKRYDIQDYLDKGLLSQSTIDQYHSGALTLTKFADQILNKSNMDLSITSTCAEDVAMVEEDNGRKIIQTTTTSSLSSTSTSSTS
ncbi:desmoplakin-A-like [Conger conger]|uniref:desmoplakin-A-like n=1 Tax=Conger conger TaxID=82655 RepID=UPI002A5AE842|nr:desmoplakin-A-like [Conger conger]